MEKYDNNGKGWYFRFDYDNNMSYKYISSIIWTVWNAGTYPLLNIYGAAVEV